MSKTIIINGTEYKSLTKACEAYHISQSTVYNRICKMHWSVEKAVTTVPGSPESHHNYIVKMDGQEFPSVKAACKHYGISYGTFYTRWCTGGRTVEEALKTAVSEKYNSHKYVAKADVETRRSDLNEIVQKYGSFPNACRAYDMESRVVYERIYHYGWTVMKALTTPRKTYGAIDHKGNHYATINEMCAAYGIDRCVYKARISQKWSVERALTTPVRANKRRAAAASLG